MPNGVRISEQKQVASVSRAIRVLELLSERGDLSLTQIASDVGAPKTSMFDVIGTLESNGMVRRNADTGLYSLGLHVIELGYSAVRQFGIRKILAPVLQALNQELDETVHLTVLDGSEVLYVDCYESTKRLRTYSVIGVRGPLHCTSVGKAILAWLPDSLRDQLVHSISYDRFTDNTITAPQDLQKDLATARSRGYTIDDVEHEEGVRCIGVPVLDQTGNVVASISISAPTQRLPTERVPELARRVMEAGTEMSRRLGYKDVQDSSVG